MAAASFEEAFTRCVIETYEARHLLEWSTPGTFFTPPFTTITINTDRRIAGYSSAHKEDNPRFPQTFENSLQLNSSASCCMIRTPSSISCTRHLRSLRIVPGTRHYLRHPFSTMAKLDVNIPDLTLPDGNKIPMVGWSRFSHLTVTDDPLDRVWHRHSMVQDRCKLSKR